MLIFKIPLNPPFSKWKNSFVPLFGKEGLGEIYLT
jgi:hypothetical protein